MMYDAHGLSVWISFYDVQLTWLISIQRNIPQYIISILAEKRRSFKWLNWISGHKCGFDAIHENYK